MSARETTASAEEGKGHVSPGAGQAALQAHLPGRHGSDIDRAKEIVTNVLAADERVLPEPPANAFVQQLADSNVELVALPFVKAEDYTSMQVDIVERVKKEFDAAGIVIPFPQQDVHVYSHS